MTELHLNEFIALPAFFPHPGAHVGKATLHQPAGKRSLGFLTGYRSWDARPTPHFQLASVDGPVVFTSRTKRAGLVSGKEGGGETWGDKINCQGSH